MWIFAWPALLLLPACDEPAESPLAPTVTSAPGLCDVDDATIDALVAEMSLPDKAAQVLVVQGSGSGEGPDDDTLASIAEVHVGALYLPPVLGVQMDPTDTARLVAGMQQAALDATGIPLFVTLDQEGGHAASLNSLNGGTDTPGNLALAQAADAAAVSEVYDLMGAELHALGFNMDFAPAVDLLADPENGALNTRTFGDDPALASELAVAAVGGLQPWRVLPTVKHAPGAGYTSVDTHAGLPVVDVDEERFYDEVIVPFSAAIDGGADGIMTTHVVFSAIDPDWPASLSEVFIRGVLRDRLGFDGIVVTDSLGMEGAIEGAGGEVPAVRAIVAGSDLALHAGAESDGAREARDALVAAVEDGSLAEPDLDEAVRRVLAHKVKYCAFDAPIPEVDAVSTLVGTAEAQARSQAVADRTVVALRDDAGLLPLSPDQRVLFVGPDWFYTDPGSGWMNLVDRTLGEVLEAYADSVARYEVALPPDPANAEDYLALAGDADVLVVATINAHYSDEQVEFFAPAFDAGKPVVLVTLGVPFDAWDFPEAATVLNVTGQRSVSLVAAAEVLYGFEEARGVAAVDMEE